MQLVEQHVIAASDSRYEAIDRAAFASKNLYNAALYEIRQSFIFEGKYLRYEEMHARMKSHEAYQALPAKVAQQVLKSLDKNWQSFFAELQSTLAQMDARRRSSHQMERLTPKRTRRIDHYLHTASRRVIDLLVQEGIGTLVIGKNANWKQEVNIGKRNNQNFVGIPHARFIDLLTYKAKLVGIQVIITEESYTSKCSFLDNEPIGKHEVYAGKRVKRGLFRTSEGLCFNADVNGSYNILRKVAPDAFSQGSRGCVVHPLSEKRKSRKHPACFVLASETNRSMLR